MPAEDSDYYNLYWTASSTNKNGRLVAAAEYSGEATGTVNSGGSEVAWRGNAERTASDDRHPDLSAGSQWQSLPAHRGLSNPFANAWLPSGVPQSNPFDETGWSDAAASWSQVNHRNVDPDQRSGDIAGPYMDRAYPYRDDSYRSRDLAIRQDESSSKDQWASTNRSTPPGHVIEPAYARLPSREHSSNGYGELAPYEAAHYENVPDAAPIRRRLEKLQSGNSALQHWNGDASSVQPSAAQTRRPGSAASGRAPSLRQQQQQFLLDAGSSIYGEESNRGGGEGAASARRRRPPTNHWQSAPEASNGSSRPVAADLAPAPADSRLATDAGSSYRTLDSADLDWRHQEQPHQWLSQQAHGVLPPSAAALEEREQQLAIGGGGWPRRLGSRNRAPDACSVTTAGSELLGPPGYGQLFESVYYNSQMQPRAVLSGSKISIDSQSQADAQWHSPDLGEVIDLLSQGNMVVLRNAAAYLQHLCFNNNGTKAKARSLGGIRVLAQLLHTCDTVDVQRVVCGCLLNLTRGRENDDAKRELRDCNGIEALARLLRKSADSDVRELATGILWNLSSCKALKRPVIDAALTVLTNTVVIPHSGWDPRRPSDGERPPDVYWSTVFRNGSGTLRNVSSDGFYARKKLRECTGLVESLLCIVKAAIGKNDIDNKSVENCVCILRNLSYRLMEIDYPDYYDTEVEFARRSTPCATPPAPSVLSRCLKGSSKKSSNAAAANKSKYPSRSPLGSGRGEQLWQSEVAHIYLPLLADCSNPDTLEAAIGALQNLTACEWQPAVDLREKIRKEKGLPIVVELLGLEADSVVCAAVIALRNLAIDSRNRELIGKYAIQPLLTKLPPRVPSMREQRFSEQTVCAVVATLQEIIKDNVEHAGTIVNEGDGLARLMTMAKSQGKYEARTLACVRQLLATLWKFSMLHPTYKKRGWKEADFTTKAMHPRSTSASPPPPQASLVGGSQESRSAARAENAAVRSDAESVASLPSAAARAREERLALHAVRPALAVASIARPGSGAGGEGQSQSGQLEAGAGLSSHWPSYQNADGQSYLEAAVDTVVSAPSLSAHYDRELHGGGEAETLPHWLPERQARAESSEPLYAKVDRRQSSARQQQLGTGGGSGSTRVSLAMRVDDDAAAAADSWV